MNSCGIFIFTISYLLISMVYQSASSHWNDTKQDGSFTTRKTSTDLIVKQSRRSVKSTSIQNLVTEVMNSSPAIGIESTKDEDQTIGESNLTAHYLSQEDVEVVCTPERSSCENLCGTEGALWNQLLCSCDVYCLIYGTCCEDFKNVCRETWQESKTMFPHQMNLKVQCLSQSPVSYLVISSCSASTNLSNSDPMQTDCENPVSEHPISIGHFHFKNVDCLRCNGFNETEGTLWSLQFRLQSEENYIWRTGPMFIDDFKSLEGSYAWIPPYPMPKICRSSIIDSCPVDTDSDLKEKCQGPKSYVVPELDGVTIYSNRYCLACNQGNATQCRSASDGDFEPKVPSDQITLANWKPFDNGEKGGIVTSNVKMFWKNIECRGDYSNRSLLDCTVQECFDFILLVDGQCTLENRKVCYFLEIDWWNVTGRKQDGTNHNEMVVELAVVVKYLLEGYIQKAFKYAEWFSKEMGASTKFQVDTINSGGAFSFADENSKIGEYVIHKLSENGYFGEVSLCFGSCLWGSCQDFEIYEIPQAVQLQNMPSGFYRNTRTPWYILVLYLINVIIG